MQSTSSRTSSARALSIALLFLVGCEQNVYELNLRPEGDTMHRELTVWRQRTAGDAAGEAVVTDLREEDLRQVTTAYDAKPEIIDDKKYRFAGRFQKNAPQDIGGFGAYAVWESPFGSAAFYTERYRGRDDLAGDLSERWQAIDQLVDLLLQWLNAELDGQSDLARLTTFVDQDFRQDLKNLATYVMAVDIVAPHGDQAEFSIGVRILQYLMERDYLDLNDMAKLNRILQSPDDTAPAIAAGWVQRMIARKLGVADDQPIPPILDFLDDPEAAAASLEEFLESTPRYKAALAKWEQNKIDDPSAKKPEAPEVFGDSIVEAFQLLPGSGDQLRVQIELPHPPYTSNGDWNDQSGTVRWEHHIVTSESANSRWPAISYAAWCKVDAAIQEKHFGKIVLDGEPLAEFCLWYNGLTADERQAWDEFVSGLRPGEELVGQLQSFRFPGEPPADNQQSTSLAEPPVSTLVEALTAESDD